MVPYLEYALLLQYLSPLDSAGSSDALFPGPSGRSSRRLALLCRSAHPHAASAARRPARAILLRRPQPMPISFHLISPDLDFEIGR